MNFLAQFGQQRTTQTPKIGQSSKKNFYDRFSVKKAKSSLNTELERKGGINNVRAFKMA